SVVWGEKDRVTPMKKLDALAHKIPSAKFTRVPGVGHMAPWESPTQIVDAINAVDATVANVPVRVPDESAP
ncbi:MAG TPA: alpha/beta hydrolase, partial [Myxococcota bacterium]